MKKYLPIIIFVVLVIVIVVMGVVINKNKNNSKTLSSTDNLVETNPEDSKVVDTSGIDAVALAKYLTSKEIGFYGAYWCPHCQDQKKLFGDAFQYVTYYECDPAGENSKAEACKAAGIESYPTWIINGQKYTGAKTLSELANLSGFQE